MQCDLLLRWPNKILLSQDGSFYLLIHKTRWKIISDNPTHQLSLKKSLLCNHQQPIISDNPTHQLSLKKSLLCNHQQPTHQLSLKKSHHQCWGSAGVKVYLHKGSSGGLVVGGAKILVWKRSFSFSLTLISALTHSLVLVRQWAQSQTTPEPPDEDPPPTAPSLTSAKG